MDKPTPSPGESVDRYLEGVDKSAAARVDALIIPALGQVGANVFGLLIATLVKELGGEKTYETCALAVATLEQAQKKAGF